MTEYPTASEMRRANLAALVAEARSQRAVAEAVDVAPAQISQWINAAPDNKTGTPRTISDESARQIEERLKKPRGWMDHDHGPADKPEPEPDAAQQIVDALADLPAARWASVRAQLDALVAHPEMRDDVLQELRILLTAPPGKRRASG